MLATEQLKPFGDIARGLSRTPLGIIALFIVLVYGFAALVTAFTGSFSPSERLPLIYFLVVFPVVVLGVFAWLVSRHSPRLFAPSDFKNEDNYVKMLSTVATSLTAAAAKNPDALSDSRIEQIIQSSVLYAGSAADRTIHSTILWVDDRPENNIHERRAFEGVGVTFTLAKSTNEALNFLSRHGFDAIISDMGRREGPREGYVLLDALRSRGDRTPLFFYAASNAPEHKRETFEHGGQGCTNNAQELFAMVMNAIRP